MNISHFRSSFPALRGHIHSAFERLMESFLFSRQGGWPWSHSWEDCGHDQLSCPLSFLYLSISFNLTFILFLNLKWLYIFSYVPFTQSLRHSLLPSFHSVWGWSFSLSLLFFNDITFSFKISFIHEDETKGSNWVAYARRVVMILH